jgi:hypothetical protein
MHHWTKMKSKSIFQAVAITIMIHMAIRIQIEIIKLILLIKLMSRYNIQIKKFWEYREKIQWYKNINLMLLQGLVDLILIVIVKTIEFSKIKEYHH